ncbi:winged helix-turn-helix transcriptional regulator [Legionella parisiensis]|uniref:Putative HTH-type transcriptional regulator YtcD n=1 Tax=Legionella parisiensis TaxID=45071 RepID=A0A1E5JRY6_9GAMM|nr:helix-turn-helix domain-containing protein [Legionella parisiensis]KTD41075.1 transcriptional regulator [Legionella parisiensis]OEH47296.1 putative HTH-type transcriptional regulator YtcD [Legionella parisiensis]STX76631.1 transcriptional regulator [Legionella parisiensis]
MSKNKFSVYNEQCPSHKVLEKIGDKWSILIINILFDKKFRFGELKREIGGISPKMLTQTLMKLERFGFIARYSFPILPMKVEYSLTALGKELGSILNSLTTWTEKNMDRIMHAESQFVETRNL